MGSSFSTVNIAEESKKVNLSKVSHVLWVLGLSTRFMYNLFVFTLYVSIALQNNCLGGKGTQEEISMN